jgi:protein-S-isoprenylcysteine O-methyltransferase Ste14
MPQSGGVDRSNAPSIAPKLTFTALHTAVLALAAWAALGGGLPDRPRALVLLAAGGLYFARQMVTLFVLLKRRLGYGEAVGLSAFLALIEIGFVLLGGGLLRGEAVPLGWLDGVAVVLILAGSWLNTGSEWQRHVWKRDPANAGHCYTGGLFARSMHINYFGDTVMFTGWALLTASAWALILPVFMALSFVFFHIPGLDAYLAGRYGDEFRAYAARTKKFVPFLY